MSIKGLTDETAVTGSGLPLIARLYKGGAKPENGKKPGADLDYFRIEFEPRFQDMATEWVDLYGEQPAEFEGIYLIGDTVDRAFETWMEEWSATTLIHRCDGERQTRWFDPANNNHSKQPIACSKANGGCKCVQVGRLRFMMPDLIERTGVLGVIQLTTHSIHDIATIHNYLRDIQSLNGRLVGIPFVLGRQVKSISVPMGDNRGRVNKSLLYMHVSPEYTRHALIPGFQAPALPAGQPYNNDTGEYEYAPGLPDGDEGTSNGGESGAVTMGVVMEWAVNRSGKYSNSKDVSDTIKKLTADGVLSANASPSQILRALQAHVA